MCRPKAGEYITIMEAARAAGEPRSSIQNLANRGQVRVQATDAPNPRRGGRLVHRGDVLGWAARSKTAKNFDVR